MRDPLRIDAEHLWVNRRCFALSSIRYAAAEERSRSVRLPLTVAALSGVVGLPTLLALLPAARGAGLEHGAWAAMFLLSATLFGAIGWVLFADGVCVLVLETSEGPLSVYSASDPQLVISLVARINGAVRAPVPERSPAPVTTTAEVIPFPARVS